VNATSPGMGPLGLAEIIFRGDETGGYDPYLLALTGTNLYFQVSDANNKMVWLVAPITINAWHHVAGTLDDMTGAMQLYIDSAFVEATNRAIRPFGQLSGANPGLGIGQLQSVT